MSKVLMKGNEAFAESCLRAGCRFFSGYPITPQTEILEYLSWRMEEVGGQFIQTESEIAGINMVFGAASGARALTTSSGPGFSLKQEGISYLCSGDIPAVIADVMRIGSGLGIFSKGRGITGSLPVAVGMEITIPLSLLHRAYKKMLTLLISPLILLKNTAILFSWHQMRRLDRWWNQLNSQL